MKNRKRAVGGRGHMAAWCGLAALCWAMALCSVARGAQGRTKVTEVNLHIQSTIQSGSSNGEVLITPGGAYDVGEVAILNGSQDWTGGMVPQVSVELHAKEGYYFGATGKGMFAFSGDEASYVSSRRKDNNATLVLRFKMGKLENGDLTVTGACWIGSDGNAVWDKNPNAHYYQVKLYREGSSVTSIRTSNESEYDFAGSITRRGDYYFEVRAVGGGSENGEWASSDSWYVSSEDAKGLGGYGHGPGGQEDPSHGPGVSQPFEDSSHGPGAKNGDSGGPGISTRFGAHWCFDQKGWWFQYPDNTYPYNCWQCIDGRWYCFNESGYLRYGWVHWEGKWYYCGPDGALMANAWTPDGYYVGPDGVWVP